MLKKKQQDGYYHTEMSLKLGEYAYTHTHMQAHFGLLVALLCHRRALSVGIKINKFILFSESEINCCALYFLQMMLDNIDIIYLKGVK